MATGPPETARPAPSHDPQAEAPPYDPQVHPLPHDQPARAHAITRRVAQPIQAPAMFDEVPVAVEMIVKQQNAITELMQQAMKKDVHFGKIPGCGDKATLLKPGAELLCRMFRLTTHMHNEITYHDGNHIDVLTTCVLRTLNGVEVCRSSAHCSTMETRYRYRTAKRVCPACQKDVALFKSNKPGEGYYCWTRKGGCGAKFTETDPAITNQKLGQVDNPNIHDEWNTVIKMSAIRAHRDAALRVTGASALFTQDMEDLPLTDKGDDPQPAQENKPPKHTAIAATAQPEPTFIPDDHRTEPEPAPSTGYTAPSSGHTAPMTNSEYAASKKPTDEAAKPPPATPTAESQKPRPWCPLCHALGSMYDARRYPGDKEWVCGKTKGGCGVDFPIDDKMVTGQNGEEPPEHVQASPTQAGRFKAALTNGLGDASEAFQAKWAEKLKVASLHMLSLQQMTILHRLMEAEPAYTAKAKKTDLEKQAEETF